MKVVKPSPIAFLAASVRLDKISDMSRKQRQKPRTFNMSSDEDAPDYNTTPRAEKSWLTHLAGYVEAPNAKNIVTKLRILQEGRRTLATSGNFVVDHHAVSLTVGLSPGGVQKRSTRYPRLRRRVRV